MGRTSDTRERLLEAAIDLLWASSFGAVSVDQICEGAGVKKGSFYHFFESKIDLAIAAYDAQLGTPEINVGLWPMMIMATIFRNVPRKRGLELIMTGDKISAQKAAEMGLITRAVPRDKLEAEVDALAEKLASKSPVVMRMGLEAFYRVQDMELEPALQHLQSQLVAVLGTEDAREGLMAFLEKRTPQWKGR